MKKLLLCTCLLAGITLTGMTQDAARITQTLETSLRERNPDLIKPYLSPGFSVGVYGAPYAYGMASKLITSYDTLERLQFKKETTTPQGKSVSLKCYYKKQSPFDATLSLDSAGKIVRISFFDQLYGVDLSRNSRLAAVIPFELVNNKIVLKLTLNNSKRVLRFLFDTGADGMGIKKEVADELGIVAKRQQQTSVVGASTEIGIAGGIDMHFDTLTIAHQNSAIFPQFDADLDGLFGANFLRKYITEIDFDQSQIRLYTFGKFNYPATGTLVPLDYSRGVPGIKGVVKLNNEKVLDGDFHFDTGAGYPLILFGPSVNKHQLTEKFAVQFYSTNYSMGHASEVCSGIFDYLKIGNLQLNYFTGTLQSYRAGDEKWSPEGDGSFGIELIKNFNCIINVADKQFSLTPNKRYTLPADFWLRDVLWGFDNGEMVIKQITPDSKAANSGASVKDVIMSINGVKAADFKSIDNIKKYVADWKSSPLQLEINKFGKPWKVDIE